MNNFTGDYAEFSPVDNANTVRDNNNSDINNVHFTVDELLDFSGEDEAITDAFFGSLVGNSTDSSSVTVVDSCNSSISGGGDGQFNGNISCRSFTDSQFSKAELFVPYDDLAELEWLSNFVEESFSSDDIHHLNFIPTPTDKTTAVASTAAATTDNSSSSSVTTTISSTIQSPLPPPIFPSDVGVPGKARSKRSRAAPCDWSSRLLHLAATPNPSTNNISINSNTKAPKTTSFKRRLPTETRGRKCLHCASETTPQWRTGPMGPKTLCNACGVRYKSGRLVPEYRPAASPTFVPAKHSNSHRKVVELRRQNERMGQVHIFNAANGCDDFLIHRQDVNGCDFGHMI